MEKIDRDCLRKCVESVLGKLHTQLTLDKLSNEQLTCLQNMVNKQDTFLMLPTGAGKSLPFQIVAEVMKELNKHGTSFPDFPIVILVSPLLSLMCAHVREMTEMGILAACLNSPEDDKILKGEFNVVLGSPEAWLKSDKWRQMLQSDVYQKRVVCLATDEVHCVPKWGLQGKKKAEAVFRECFGRLGELRTILPVGTPVLAMTATATSKSREKIFHSLCMLNPKQIVCSPNRKNIKLSVRRVPTSVQEGTASRRLETSEQYDFVMQETLTDIREQQEKADMTIVYCRTVKDCGELFEHCSRELGSHGHVSGGKNKRLFAMYHHSTPEDVKEEVLQSLLGNGQFRLVIATNALGMGVNAPHIRHVVNFGLPDDLESYVQEIGRAGRDGKQASATLFFKSLHLLQGDQQMKNYAKNNTMCRRAQLMEHFEDQVHLVVSPHQCCDVCDNSQDDAKSLIADTPTSHVQIREVDDPDRTTLKGALQEYRDSLIRLTGVSYHSFDVCSGFTMRAISDIVALLPFVSGSEFVMQNTSIIKTEYASGIFAIILELFHDDSDDEDIFFPASSDILDTRLKVAEFCILSSDSD